MTIVLILSMTHQPEQRQHQEPSKRIDSAVIIFTAPLVQQLSSTEIRLPPNYVGVRKVRPSSRGVAAKLHESSNDTSISSNIVFKVKDKDGNERRMTNQEKKALKQKIASEKKAQKATKKRNLEEISTNSSSHGFSDMSKPNDYENKSGNINSRRSYHQLSVNQSEIEQELAELRGDRSGLRPVILSPPMALQAAQTVFQEKVCSEECCLLMYDKNLSQTWAQALKDNMSPAENFRKQEDLRPMAYQLTPEPWHRCWPNHRDGTKLESRIEESLFGASLPSQSTEREPSTASVSDKCEWAVVNCRPPSDFDIDVSIVFEYLHKASSFFISCGAKFGSDFLIYDGPREERHAFAGMRILLSSKGGELPLPTTYSLAAYVRCLNKAGKLALLATVVRDQSDEGKSLYRIALVDVALEKILAAPTHQNRSRQDVRRDISRNLAKK